MIAVTFALCSESSEFVKLLAGPRRGAPGSHRISGTLHGREVCVLHTGVGEKITRTRVAAFLEKEAPQLLISAGFAGALSDGMKVGDLLLAKNYSSPELMRRAAPNDCVTGVLATASQTIDSVTHRQALACEKGADAVDMETQFIAELCAAAGVPLLSLRVISDTPSASFPAPPHILFDIEQQRTRFTPLFFYLLTHPQALGKVIFFARQIGLARASLTQGLDSILRSDAF